MIFKGPAGFGRIVNGIMNIIMCSVLSFYVLWTMQNIPGNEALPILTPIGFFVSLVTSFCVGEFVGDHVPAMAWGTKLAHAMHIKNRVAVHLIAVVILAIVMVTSISFVCTWINNVQTPGGMGAVIASWLMVYPVLLGAGYVVLAAFLPPVMKMATAVSGFDPTKAPPPPPPPPSADSETA
jgi:hypothetical protein